MKSLASMRFEVVSHPAQGEESGGGCEKQSMNGSTNEYSCRPLMIDGYSSQIAQGTVPW
jgi:hypothetical protein